MAHALNKLFPADNLAKLLGCKMIGEIRAISCVAGLSESSAGALVFSSMDNYEITAGVVVLGPEALEAQALALGFTLLVSRAPRLDFMRALQALDNSPGFVRNEAASVIHPTAHLGSNVVIEPGCVVGRDVIIEHNVVIHSGTEIGDGSRIRANASIGGDGFGFERDDFGRPLRFIHLGGVRIGRNVEIGSNSCIARGTLGMTVIEDDVKIDNLVHVAHNCHIESGAFVIACAEVSGGVRVGRNAWVGPNASILQKKLIGEKAVIGLGAVVTKDVPAGNIYAGNPARFFRKVGEEQ